MQSRIVLTPPTMLIRPSLDGVSSVRELFGRDGRPSDHTGPALSGSRPERTGWALEWPAHAR